MNAPEETPAGQAWPDEIPSGRRSWRLGRAFSSWPRPQGSTLAAWGSVAVSAALLLALLVSTHVFGIVPTDAGDSGRAGGQLNSALAARLPQLPAGMPTHFAFGVMNAGGDVALLNDMRTRNGTAWDFRYQYLSGGVNTGTGWETWTTPQGAPFLTSYLSESADNHYTPALVYYELLQSKGTCGGCAEAQRDLTNLQDPHVMAAYFANWRLLMQQLGAFGRPVLVIVEPDLWGYMERSAIMAQSNTPAAVPASVGSSGDADTARLPDTGQGFAWALLHIRDRYAPNALLALHVSNWATGDDLNSSSDPTLDPVRLAGHTAQFLLAAGLQGNPPGISSWDLLSNDVADHDSGQGAPWWDRTNQQYPNFTRYLAYITALTRATGKWVVMWQVPEGNQYFETMNNTPHHTQDNRAEYILSHIPDFARAGVAAVLFGAGNNGTTIDDTAHDGITNPPPIVSFECDQCNTHVSLYPDDDGGYLRIFVGAYYAHGVLSLADPGAWSPPPAPNPGATATPVPQTACAGIPRVFIGTTRVSPNPVAPGKSVTFTVYVTLGCSLPALVDVEVYGGGGRLLRATHDGVRFTAFQPRAVDVQATVPANAPAGSYVVKVGVFQAGWGVLYAWNDGAAGLRVQ
jgi:hypothetical protein